MNDASPPYGSKQNMAQLINVGETDEGTGIQARTRSPHRGWLKTNSPAMDTTEIACDTGTACNTEALDTEMRPATPKRLDIEIPPAHRWCRDTDIALRRPYRLRR